MAARRWLPPLPSLLAPLDGPPVPGLRPDDAAHCRRVLAAGSKSFAAAGALLPRHTLDAAAAVYAFCRVSDDAVDLAPTRAAAAAAVAALEARLARLYAAPDGAGLTDPVDRAFAAVIHARRIPRAAPAGLLEGYAWDAEGRRYATLPELRAFCARVAATVGVMMTCVLGRRQPAVLARACDLGVAMQLTNIARDVGEDAAAGRLYLPLDWLREVGVDPAAFLAAPRFDGRIRAVVERLLAAADGLYRRAESGIAALPLPARPAIYAARLVYAAIGTAIRAAGGDSVTARRSVPAPFKAALVARALVGAPFLPPLDPAPPLPETAFLCEPDEA